MDSKYVFPTPFALFFQEPDFTFNFFAFFLLTSSLALFHLLPPQNTQGLHEEFCQGVFSGPGILTHQE